MKIRIISNTLLIATCLAVSSLKISAQSLKPQVAYGPNSINHVDRNDFQALDSSLVNFLGAINTNSFEDCFSVDFKYLQNEWYPFLFLDDAQKSGRHNDPWFYKPVVTYAVPLENDSYNIKIAFIGKDPETEDPIFRLIYSLIARKSGDVFQFFSPLETVKTLWNQRKTGNITFYYQGVFDERVAEGFSEFNAQLAEKLGVDVIDVSYFRCQDGRELFYIIGCDYISNAYFARTGGLADPSRNYIFAGNNSEAYPHELVHLYVAKKFDRPRNYIAEEGYCTYIGGSGELTLEELLTRTKDFLRRHPEADIMDLFMSDVQINNEYSLMYAISGLLIKAIEDKHGMEGIHQIITTENKPGSFFETLNELLGINEENFSDKVTSLLAI